MADDLYLGFDRSDYPGDAVMQSLWDSVQRLTFVCLYLAPAPSHPGRSWMNAAPALASMGWGLLPTYVGQQVIGPGSHIVTAEQGVRDAQDAASLASEAGLGSGAVLYLDIENGGTMPPNQVGYVTSWIKEVNTNTDYWAGVYCHRTTAPQIESAVASIVADVGHEVPTWTFGGPIDTGPRLVDLDTELPKDPAQSGYAEAIAWQYRMSYDGNIDLIWTDYDTGARKRLNKVDLDSAVTPNPMLA
jgi:Domain of unknown function (DUF1906).